jgi:hypothetical protein
MNALAVVTPLLVTDLSWANKILVRSIVNAWKRAERRVQRKQPQDISALL